MGTGESSGRRLKRGKRASWGNDLEEQCYKGF